MKALKSQRARVLLADPVARGELRSYLEGRSRSAESDRSRTSVVIKVHPRSGPALRLTPVVVAKAA